MASQNVLELTDASFDEQVLRSEVPVLVDLWASWCPPCRIIAPTIDEIADEYAGRFRVGKLDTDANQQIATKLGISAIPTLLVYHRGTIVRRFVGVTPKHELVEALENAAA